ncbi:MAG: tyrosine--tRNA ligase [Firmicutes bacterium]|nr:tyrosine--tRNA ligase [Bacillota bacterium]
MLRAEEQLAIIKENVEEIISEDGLKEKLKRSVADREPLCCKLGLDPSAPDLHLGHAVVLDKIRTFQDLGHRAVIILGDFTGRIGDPTGRSETRKQLTEEEVMANARTYQEQLFKVLDPERTEIKFNGQWLEKLSMSEVIRVTSTYTVARMLEREDFAVRYRENQPISIHEFLYPLLQGYDSVAINADIEFGATEQKFNLLMGRHLQREYGQEPQVALTMPILTGTDGLQKMSKSLGNYIGVNEEPVEIYGKVMSISDELMPEYYRLASTFKAGQVEQILEEVNRGDLHPRDAKMRLAFNIVARYHGSPAAHAAEENFKRVFQRGGIPGEMPTHEIAWSPDLDLVPLLTTTGLTSSNSEARRLIRQGGVRVNSKQVNSSYKFAKADSYILQVGKRRFVRLILK